MTRPSQRQPGVRLALLALAGLFCTGAGRPPEDTLARLFRDPPMSARPQVWWHWVGGNVTSAGIAADLAWMRRIGIGGVHIFDVNLPQPRHVDRPLRYMTPAWRTAFRQAVDQARADGMTVGIAASPGWSESGGPWVPPQDGMKKLVWSEMAVRGGRRVSLALPRLPDRAGPFQDAAPAPDSYAAAARRPLPLAVNVAVLAIPMHGGATLPAGTLVTSARLADTARLRDGHLSTGIDLPAGSGWLRYDFTRPVVVRSAVLGRAASTLIEPTGFAPSLEADDGGGFRPVATFATGTAPQQTLDFAPVRARRFRLRYTTDKGGAQLTEFRLSAQPRVHRFEDKAGFGPIADPDALATPDAGGVDPHAIVDLSSRVDSHGRLRWRAPPGRWRVLRLGWSLTGKVNHPSVPEATGLEVDKLDPAAVRRYALRYLDEVARAAPLGSAGVSAMTLDSIEAGAQNWTPGLIGAFRQRRGYDPLPYLPAMAGIIVGDARRSDRFLFDLRQTLGEMVAEAHYGTIADVARARGLTVYGEAMEFARTIEGDDMAMRTPVDIPMAAMWSFPTGAGPEATALADLRGAASVAHLYGKSFVAAELLTSIDALWSHAPADLRPMIDRAFATGVNLPVIHSSVHQPQAECAGPGLTLGVFGQTFNRCETWAELARPWMDYVARTAFLLQQGAPVADMLYFAGEDAPLVARFAAGPPADAPPGNGWDYVNAATLAHLRVENGDIVAPGGTRYRLLWLGPGSRRMTRPVLHRITGLLRAGATIAGARPEVSPALADDAASFRREAAALLAEHRTSSGRFMVAATAAQALATAGIAPAYRVRAGVEVVQRRDRERDIFFVVNHGRAALADVWFGSDSGSPEVWHAEDGGSEQVVWRREAGGTRVALGLAPARSAFVVFDHGKAAAARPAAPTEREIDRLDRWTIGFPGREARPVDLGSWTTLDPAARRFSGTARYTTDTMLPAAPHSGSRIIVDLGGVADIAQVFVNGSPAGIAWEAPWRVDVTRLLHAGNNRIEVRVTNLWVNRLATATVPRPSGLLGPVRLLELR